MEGNNFQPISEQNISQADRPPVDPVPQEAPPTTQEKESQSWKILVYGLPAIASIVLGALGLWFYQEKIGKKPTPPAKPTIATATPTPIIPTLTPTPESTIPANWKTYRNEEYGFEFKHPAVWKIKVVGYEEGPYILVGPADPEKEYKPDIRESVVLDIGDIIPPNVSLKDYVESAVAFEEEAVYIKDTLVGGIPAKEIRVREVRNLHGEKLLEPSAPYSRIIFFRQSKVYRWEEPIKASPELENTFNQILSTFKFLD